MMFNVTTGLSRDTIEGHHYKEHNYKGHTRVKYDREMYSLTDNVWTVIYCKI